MKVFTIDGWPSAHFGQLSDDSTGVVVGKVDSLNIVPDRAYGGTTINVDLSIDGMKWGNNDTFSIAGQTNVGNIQYLNGNAVMEQQIQFAIPPVNSFTTATLNVVRSGIPSSLPNIFFVNNTLDTGVWEGTEPGSILPFLMRRIFASGSTLEWKSDNFDGKQALWGQPLTQDELAFLDQVKQRSDVPSWVLISDLSPDEVTLADQIFSEIQNADDRHEAYANFKSRLRIIQYISIMQGSNDVLNIYRLCRDLNPLAFAWERGWEIGSGQEQFTRIKTSQSWAAAQLLACLAIIKITDVGINEIYNSITQEALAYTPVREILPIKINPNDSYPKTV